ncbi:MAG TPA: hypothetical protein VF765_34870 [Polyangiaceae bacterium]
MNVRTLVRCLSLTLLFTLGGCFHLPQSNLRVDPASPRPNVDLPAAGAPSRLKLGDSIVDQFVIPKSDSVNAVPVSGWRTTLSRGFDSGFKGGTSGLVLQIREAELTFAPAALRGGITSAARARIRYKASLLDPSGKELARLSGDADAHDAITQPQPSAMTANAAQAVEAMYETIAAKLVEGSAEKQP